MEILYAIPVMVIIASAVASYYRVKSYKSKFNHPLSRTIDYCLTFLFAFLSGLLLYQPIIDTFGLSQNLEVFVAMSATVVSEGAATSLLKIAQDPRVMKEAIIRMIKKIIA